MLVSTKVEQPELYVKWLEEHQFLQKTFFGNNSLSILDSLEANQAGHSPNLISEQIILCGIY